MNQSLQHVTCAVCTEVYFEPVLLPNCPHTFCRGCLERLQKPECPLCRAVCPPVAKLHKNVVLDSVIQQQFPTEWAARKASESSTVDEWVKRKQENGYPGLKVNFHRDLQDKVARDVLRELDRVDVWTNIESEFHIRSKKSQFLSSRWIAFYTPTYASVSLPDGALFMLIQWQNGAIYVAPLVAATGVVATDREIRWNSPLDLPSPPHVDLWAQLDVIKSILQNQHVQCDLRVMNALSAIYNLQHGRIANAINNVQQASVPLPQAPIDLSRIRFQPAS